MGIAVDFLPDFRINVLNLPLKKSEIPLIACADFSVGDMQSVDFLAPARRGGLRGP